MGVHVKPDFPNGQYWGLPPYNWEAIEKSETPMLLERIHNFSLIYDIYRLDSCLGYFSQYEIPLNSHPKEGKFVPSNEQAALDNGKKILTSLSQQDEGINIPGTNVPTDWTYRFKLSVEELISNPEVRSFAMPQRNSLNPSSSGSNHRSHASASRG
jgi:4-alpha-glucanotransferase